FNLFGQLLEGKLPKNKAYFDPMGREDLFPLPDRDVVYEKYPQLADSPIKSMFASVGCPFHCSYCYAPSFNKMHGGFKFITSEVDRLIAEAHDIQRRWPLQMVYFQDDIFGFEYKEWLPEFTRRWKQEVGEPAHIQLRTELLEGDAGKRRLDLFQEAGVTGVTLAIESGNPFLRTRVLMRHMPHELIVESCEKIIARGMTLRTEQILAVPFSSTETDLSTLKLNNEIGPDMAWPSTLSPYLGTSMGTIAKSLGFYAGNNDDLSDTFFQRSVLRHVAGGTRDIERIVEGLKVHPKAPPEVQPLQNTWAVENGTDSAQLTYQKVVREKVDGKKFEIVKVGEPREVGTIEYLSEKENSDYCDSVVRLQELFIPLAKMPDAVVLAKRLLAVPKNDWNWKRIGQETTAHLRTRVPGAELERRLHALAHEMHLQSPSDLPEVVVQNPHYFPYFPAGGALAQKVVETGFPVSTDSTPSALGEVATITRRHEFGHGLYKVEKGPEPIAK
ncbi:MAG: radical SAM protein, partial [bacterium]|nr:radical SAM protein [bacterium]